MVRPLPLSKYIGLFLLFLAHTVCVRAVDRTFVPTSGTWNVSGNWNPSGVPAPADNVFIPSGKACNLDIAVSRSGNVSIASGGSLKLLQNYSQNGGLISISGSGIFDVSSVTLTFVNGCNVSGLITNDNATNLIFTSCPLGTTSPQFSTSINNLLVGSSSTVDLGFDLTSVGTITVGSGNILSVGSKKIGINSTSGSGVIQFSNGPTGSIVEYIGSGPISVSNLNVRSLILSRSGSVTLGGNIVLADELIVGNSTTVLGTGFVTISPFAGTSISFVNNNIFSLSTATSTFNLGSTGSFKNNKTINQAGNLTVNGTFENYGDFNFVGGHSVTISGSVLNGTAGKFNFSGIDPSLTINVGASHTFINQGEFKTGSTSNITISSDLPNGFQNQASGKLDLASTLTFSNGNTGITNLGTLVSNPGIFSFTGSGNPIINLPKNQTFTTILVNKSGGTVGLSGSGKLIVLDAINVTAGTFDLGGKSVILKSGPTGTARIGRIGGNLIGSGNITIERYFNSNSPGWYFIGNSMLGQSFSDWTDDFEISGPFPGASIPTSADRATVFVYDGAASPNGANFGEVNGWRLPTSGNIVNGLGYRVFLKSKFFSGSGAAKIIDNTGDIVKGTFPFPVTFNTQGYGGGGWNFLSNPYPSQIDWNAAGWTKTNVGGAIYVWNGQTGQYGAYNFANDPPGSNPGTNGVSNIIASGQAFFVRTTAPGPVLQATENVKSGSTSNFLRSAVSESSYFRITLSNNAGYSDDNVIRFYDNSSTEFDSDVDAYKMTGSILNLSTTTPGGSRLCINTFPRITDDIFVIPLNATAFNDNSLNLKFSEFGTDAQVLTIMLRDKYLNTLSVIQEGTVYRFTTNADPASKGDGRFEILLTKTKSFTGKIDGPESNLISYTDPSNSGKLFVKVLNPKPGVGEIRLVDGLGRILYEQEINPTNQLDFLLPCQLSPGLYFVEFSQKGLNLRSKTLIKD